VYYRTRGAYFCLPLTDSQAVFLALDEKSLKRGDLVVMKSFAAPTKPHNSRNFAADTTCGAVASARPSASLCCEPYDFDSNTGQLKLEHPVDLGAASASATTPPSLETT
jgi:hypothetical protein